MKDATGQATEALSRTDWFIKWGQHYLPSLAGAHFNQLCNNFKDPGVQHYSGTLFESLRDELNDLFNSLPPWHPVRINGTWVFPGEVGETKVYNREQVYNFVLGHGHIVTIGGIECATLGHGFTDNDVIQHDYFGTHLVIDDLIKFPVDSDGSIVVLPQHVKRDDNSKRVVSIA